jgi:hypothetical protein
MGVSSINLKIAMITSGAFRSFVFVERSWKQYIFSKYPDIKLFAHVFVDNLDCPLQRDGLSRLQSMATFVETSTQHPLNKYNTSEIPKIFHKSFWYLWYPERKHVKGNIVDMYDRRARAFELAVSYGRRNNFDWDLMFYHRLDSAMYSPEFDFHRLYFQIQKSTTNPIMTPDKCGFNGGFCDRLLIGSQESLKKIFRYNFVYDTLNWVTTTNGELVERYLQLCKEKVISEVLLMISFTKEGIVRLGLNPDVSFITLRTRTAVAYCTSSKSSYIAQSRVKHSGIMVRKMYKICKYEYHFISDAFNSFSPQNTRLH